ncbi:hypothetical protein I4U23_011050 [Adineta vaga]|nr:hypothetical protein I4U23_011050 [Adineta vaga]
MFYITHRTRSLYRALNNHVIILLLIINAIQTLTDVPICLNYYFTGKHWPRTVIFFYPCERYYDEESSLYVAACYLWASIQ